MTNEKITITATDRNSALWDKLQAYWAQELTKLRAQNDADATLEATAKLRGRIQQIKLFISLNDEMPKVDAMKSNPFGT